MTSVAESMRSGVGALNNFSSVLSSLFDSFDQQLVNTQSTVENTTKDLDTLRESSSLHETRLRKLEAETDGQREVIENAMRTIVGVQKNIDTQLNDATRNLHKEIISQRTMTKMDISSLRGRLHHSMSEAMSMLSETTRAAPFLGNPGAAFAADKAGGGHKPITADTTPMEGLKYLEERIEKLEELVGFQHTLNNQISIQSLKTDEMVQSVYDNLFEEIQHLQKDSATIKQENTVLKVYLSDLKKRSEWQGQQINDLLEAINSKEKMKILKLEVSKGERRLPPAVALEKQLAEQRQLEEADHQRKQERLIDLKMNQQWQRDEEKKRRKELRHSQRDEARRFKPGQRDIAEEEAADLGMDLDEDLLDLLAEDEAEEERMVQRMQEEGASLEEIAKARAKSAELREQRKKLAKEEDKKRRASSRKSTRSNGNKGRRRKTTGSGSSKRRAAGDEEDEEEEGDDAEEEGEDQGEEVKEKKTAKKSKMAAKKASSSTAAAAAFDDSEENSLKEGSGAGQPTTSKQNKKKKAIEEDDNDNHSQQSSNVFGEDMASYHSDEDDGFRSDEGEDGDDADYDDAAYDEDYEADRRRLQAALDKLTKQHQALHATLGEHAQETKQRLAEVETMIGTFKRIAYVIDDLKINFESVKNKVEAVVGSESIEEKLDASLFAKIQKAQDYWSRVRHQLTFALDNLPHTAAAGGGGGGDGEQGGKAAGDDHSVAGNAGANMAANAGQQQHDGDNHSLGGDISVDSRLIVGIGVKADLSALPATSGGAGGDRDSEGRYFFQKARDLLDLIQHSLPAMVKRDTLQQTLDHALPALNKLYDLANLLLAMDETARKSQALDYCFDDLLCVDLTPSLRYHLSDANKFSLPVLDAGIHGSLLQRDVQRLVKELEKKAQHIDLIDLEKDVKQFMANKLDIADFKNVTSKLASLAELQRLQQQIAEGKIGGVAGTAGSSATAAAAAMAAANHAGLLMNRDALSELIREMPFIHDLKEKMDVLGNVVGDMKTAVNKMVPKEEVAEALRAVILELKQLRRNAIQQQTFKEALKLKADAKEVEKLIRNITDVLGDINLSTGDLAQAAAFHAKCLLCDKPVTSQRARVKTANGSAGRYQLDNPLAGSGGDYQINASNHETTTTLPSIRNSAASPKSNKLRLVSDVAIVRTSIDPLPEITDSYGDSSPRLHSADPPQQFVAQGNAMMTSSSVPSFPPVQQQPSIQQQQQVYKQRIRASAGGGMGPGYKMDTR